VTDLLLSEAKVMNEFACSKLIEAMDTTKSGGRITFGIIKRSKMTAHPYRNSEVAWKGLKTKYTPKTGPSLTKINKLFYSAKLKKKMDPDTFIHYLEDLRAQMAKMGSEMTDKQFMMQVTNNLTNEYKNQVNDIEKRIGHDNDPIDIKELRVELSLRFECLHIKDNESNSREDKKALFDASQFKGQCRQCGKWGHKGTDCHSKGGEGKRGRKPRGNSGRFNNQ
jgi:hypothetical protein